MAIVAGVILASVPAIWFLASDLGTMRSTDVAMDARLTALEKLVNDRHAEDTAARVATNQQLNAVIQAIADARVAIERAGNAHAK
jgi:hypothetical protein